MRIHRNHADPSESVFASDFLSRVSVEPFAFLTVDFSFS